MRRQGDPRLAKAIMTAIRVLSTHGAATIVRSATSENHRTFAGSSPGSILIRPWSDYAHSVFLGARLDDDLGADVATRRQERDRRARGDSNLALAERPRLPIMRTSCRNGPTSTRPSLSNGGF
jgi:hypothetical protein